ncbi:MAG: hypothetical protein COU33_00425 [Candidatus Magasanikbacteria bacterium CG10_big_fil_rev_8_21_14_0_10_43_6]|uniref:Cell envelope-related transcriptional attenuator domain-containing protein n=1 Tax=Candidatus Magasanikbacteria bacterium CG10_big_fil_rev_8_21_14_0_10_43_6 TaxID=1974650 RepID=A0A2M6W293_9BACT|nr:MAG: hypothetical protein COU33_00425 [Candidatus Magasanikbacteria bacterium CG10_big_fil_rev_8_21_14_0_10_43_6]
MKRKIIIAACIIACPIFIVFLIKGLLLYQEKSVERAIKKMQDQAVEQILTSRKLDHDDGTEDDPFDEQGVIKILFIGIDARVGQEHGHCDAIQLITIDKNNGGRIEITAVPRGTYSPLPAGKGTTSSDYYVSNACGLGGLDYGVKQMEKILGVQTDYLVVIGFSETLGILRYLGLPSTETLQWLRNRHGYVIGEPQRAHNHSTFIKQMIIKFVPRDASAFDTPLQYTVYKLVKTDLSFSQVQNIAKTISSMNIVDEPDKIHLSMRPLYHVQDISYDAEHVQEYLDQTLGPIKHLLSKDDYSDRSVQTIQEGVVRIMEENKDNIEFVSWAYQNNLWLQIEDATESLALQYAILEQYIRLLPTKEEQQAVLADYVIEMENRGEDEWLDKGRKLLLNSL